MATMIVHLDCKAGKPVSITERNTVEPRGVIVWAYDHDNRYGYSGLLNEFHLPCRLCGIYGTGYDGYTIEGGDWEALKTQARLAVFDWQPSPNNQWFGETCNREIGAFYEVRERAIKHDLAVADPANCMHHSVHMEDGYYICNACECHVSAMNGAVIYDP